MKYFLAFLFFPMFCFSLEPKFGSDEFYKKADSFYYLGVEDSHDYFDIYLSILSKECSLYSFDKYSYNTLCSLEIDLTKSLEFILNERLKDSEISNEKLYNYLGRVFAYNEMIHLIKMYKNLDNTFKDTQ